MTISSSRDKIRYIRGLHLYQTCQIFLADFSRLSRQRVEATMAVLLRPRGLPNRWRQIETQSRRHQVPTCYTWNVQSSLICNIYSKDLGCWGEWEEVWWHEGKVKTQETQETQETRGTTGDNLCSLSLNTRCWETTGRPLSAAAMTSRLIWCEKAQIQNQKKNV